MEQNRNEIEALIEDARRLRSADAGQHIVAGWHTALKWVESLSKSVREAVRAGHNQTAHH